MILQGEAQGSTPPHICRSCEREKNFESWRRMSELSISNNGGYKTFPNHSKCRERGWEKQITCEQLLGAAACPG